MNLQMLAADSQEYFTDSDKQDNVADSDVIDADDPNNMEKIRSRWIKEKAFLNWKHHAC